MADFELRYESVDADEDIDVIISSFDDGSEQRRLRNSMPSITYKFKSPACTMSQMQAYLTFYRGKLGPRDTFTWLNPFTEETEVVRFVPKSMKYNFSKGYYTVQWSFVYRDDPLPTA